MRAYTDIGPFGCITESANSYGHYAQDAATVAAWGIDALTVDWCGAYRNDWSFPQIQSAFTRFGGELAQRGVTLDMALYDPRNESDNSDWASEIAETYRIGQDIGALGQIQFSRVLAAIDRAAAHPETTFPGHFRDLDMIVAGVGPITDDEGRLQMSMFTREASGFGIAGHDGFAPERIAEMAKTGALFERHASLVDAYEPDHARVGVVFDPTTYYLDYAQYGERHELAVGSLAGYLQTLERLQVPYEIVEAKRRARLAGCRVLIVPWPLHVDRGLAEDVLAWVRAGGTLLVESEADAYDALGFYRYPGERPFADALGIRSLGRRTARAEPVPWAFAGESGELAPHSWLEPYATDGVEVLGETATGALVVRRAVGDGQVIAVGTFAGLAAADAPSPELERFVAQVVASGGGRPELACSDGDGDRVQWRLGRAGGHRLLIVTNGGPARTLRFSGAALEGAGTLDELAHGTSVPVRDAAASVEVPGDGYSVLCWRA